MKTSTSLSHLSNSELLSQIKVLVAEERKVLTLVLDQLAEVGRRKLYAELGYSSLYDYAVRELGYSEAAAFRRVASVRLMLDVPDVREKIETGSLSLSVAAQAETFFRKEKTQTENKNLILEKLENQSSRQCEKTLISLSANPETHQKPDSIKPESEKRSRIQFSADNALLDDLEKIRGFLAHKNPYLSMAELIQEMAHLSLDTLDPVRRPSRKKKVSLAQTPDKAALTPTSEQQTRKPNTTDSTLTLTPTSESQTRKPDMTDSASTTIPTPTPKPEAGKSVAAKMRSSIVTQSRRLAEQDEEDFARAQMGLPRKRIAASVAVERAVHQREGGCCTYVSPQGRRCGSRFMIDLDHLVEFAKGGSNTVENLTLRCRTHSLFRAIQSYGWKKMDPYLTKSQPMERWLR